MATPIAQLRPKEKERTGIRPEATIERIEVSAYVIPTDLPEADGTLAWKKTTLVVVDAFAGNRQGLGYTYADTASAQLIKDTLTEVVTGIDAFNVSGAWSAMVRATRNLGRQGITAMAISAVDAALWDLKARLLDLPLVTLLGATRESVPAYGSGGFTSYSLDQLQKQLRSWVESGIVQVKMKVGTDPEADLNRVKTARLAIGPKTKLFVDANGAYSRKEALNFAERFRHDCNVSCFEEPVPSDDLEGLRLMRDRGPAGMDITAGEYGYDSFYFRRMLDAGAVDVLQADASRCGITGFVQVAAMCDASLLPLSAHCAPSLHLHPCCATNIVRHLEYFHDHVRIEHMLFDGAIKPIHGQLYPDLSRPGMGLEFKRQDAKRFAV
jgi:L-alanine-DL-glutamate epimerase-like enolase superfamily enzyme